jgi:hypothetical protein
MNWVRSVKAEGEDPRLKLQLCAWFRVPDCGVFGLSALLTRRVRIFQSDIFLSAPKWRSGQKNERQKNDDNLH